MKKLLFPAVLVIIMFSSAFTFFVSQNWAIGQDFAVKFSDKNATGSFSDLKGTVIFDEANPSVARFDVTIDVNSINTGNWLKNRHAKSDKWFDAGKYPVIHFSSSNVTKSGSAYLATGELELHGVKKQIAIPFTFHNNSSKGEFKSTFKINRADFGIGEKKGNESDITTLDITVPVHSK